MLILRLALKELRFSGSKLRLVVFILSIGFIGPFFSSALRSSVAEYLEASSKKILAADLAVSSLKPFEQKQIDWLRTSLAARKIALESEFVTMAKGPEVAALVEVKGVDPGFPIFGAFKLRHSAASDAVEIVTDATELSGTERIAWAYPEVLAQLGLKIGESVGVGKAAFKIVAELLDAPGAGRTGGFAPRLYVGRKFIEDTALTVYGAQVSHRAYLELPPGLDADDAGDKVKEGLSDPDIFIRTPDDAIQGFERFFKFFNLYLVAITMIVFVLSWMSAFYILQIFLQERLKNAAVFMINGGARWKAAALYGTQVVLVMAAAFLIAGCFVQAITLGANQFLTSLLPDGFHVGLALSDVASLAAVALVSALAFNAPFFVRLYFLKLQTLLGESALGVDRIPRATSILSYAPLVLIFLAMATLLMDSALDAVRIAGGMLVAAGVGLFAGRVLFRAFFAAVKSRPGFTRIVATSLSRSRFGVNLCFLALVLVALALNLVPHLLTSVVSEVLPLEGKEVPALFLFNIPESGLENLKAFAAKRGIELRFLSPMVLGRLNSVNGHETESDQFQRFPVRLSYRGDTIPSERIVAGKLATETFDSASGHDAEISVETGFAERNGFHLGDTIDFEVQSVPIKARITSLRHVQWTSFNPNFFIMFQKGVLDDAPKTFIANVNIGAAPAPADADRLKVKTQYELTRDFPDLSVIDIGRTINRVLEIARSVIGPVRVAAWVAVLMSFLILIGIISHNLKLRDAEVDIEKLLGADASLIRNLIVTEYGVTAAFAWLVGAGSAVGLAWLLMRQFLDAPLTISFAAIAGSFVATIAVTLAIAFVSIGRVLALRGASRRL